MTRVRYRRVTKKIIIALFTSGLAYFITNLSDQPQIWAITISVFIGGVTLVTQSIIGYEAHLENFASSLEKLVESHRLNSNEIRSLIDEGFARTNEATKLFQAVEASPLQANTVIQLVRQSTQIEPDLPKLVYGFANWQIKRTSEFLKELSESRLFYDGEDRDYLLGLTEETQFTIEATSMSTVDAGAGSFSGGLWTSEFGRQYLERQREAIHRGVMIRRIFIPDSPGQIKEPNFLQIYRYQQEIGIHARVLEKSKIPHGLKNALFDFVVFDGVISYEVTPAAPSEDNVKPTIVKTQLENSRLVQERMRRFENLWGSAEELD